MVKPENPAAAARAAALIPRKRVADCCQSGGERMGQETMTDEERIDRIIVLQMNLIIDTFLCSPVAMVGLKNGS